MESPRMILIAHDKAEKREKYRKMLLNAGENWAVETATCGEDAIEKAQLAEICVAVLDVRMPRTRKDEKEGGHANDEGGIYALESIVPLRSYLPIILFSNDEPKDDVLNKARELRIFDYLVRNEPHFEDKFVNRVRHAVELFGHRQKMLFDAPSEIVFRSTAMERVVLTAREVARTDAPVLIVGETGAGKELVAREVHRYSKRKDRIFLTVNCAALPETLVESEMFGHVEGAFTGAIRRRRGKLEQAEHGTLFLDEIGDMTLATQAKLLRAIERHEFQPVGGEETKTVDVRIICATNKNLEEEVKNERFRDDLYYRICFEKIEVPPLRERVEDIEELVQHFVDVFCEKAGRKITVSEDVFKRCKTLFLRGNVRELQAVTEAALSRLGATEDELTEFHLEPALFKPSSERGVMPRGLASDQELAEMVRRGEVELDKAVERFKFTLIDVALKQSGDIAERAAKLLGVNAHTLRRYIREREDKKDSD